MDFNVNGWWVKNLMFPARTFLEGKCRKVKLNKGFWNIPCLYRNNFKLSTRRFQGIFLSDFIRSFLQKHWKYKFTLLFLLSFIFSPNSTNILRVLFHPNARSRIPSNFSGKMFILTKHIESIHFTFHHSHFPKTYFLNKRTQEFRTKS